MSDDYNVFAGIDDFLNADDSIEILNSAISSPQAGSSIGNARGNETLMGDLDFSPVVKGKPVKISAKVPPKTTYNSDECISEDDDHSAVVQDANSSSSRRRTTRNSRSILYTDRSVADIFSEMIKTRAKNKRKSPKKSGTAGKTKRTLKKPSLSDEIIDLGSDDGSDFNSVPRPTTHFDEENAEIMIKVNWESSNQKIPIRKHQQFLHLCEILAKQSGNDAKTIVLTMNDKLISHTDTPDSVKYNIGKFIHARSMKTAVVQSSKNTTSIRLKIQSASWKNPIFVNIEPKQKMKVLVILCAEQLKCSPTKLRLDFDGEFLDMEATPEDLELEGGEVLDLRIID